MTIRKQDISGVRLVDNLPPISYKQNGFAAGDYAKGSFKVKNGQIERMFVNKNGHPYLLLNTTYGDIYYNSDERDMEKLEKEIIQWQPDN